MEQPASSMSLDPSIREFSVGRYYSIHLHYYLITAGAHAKIKDAFLPSAHPSTSFTMAAPPIDPNEATLRLDDYTEFTQQIVARVSSGGPTRLLV